MPTEDDDKRALKKTIEKVTKLVRLAADGDEEENRTAALQAVHLMKDHELVLIPASELERIKKVIGDAQMKARDAAQSAQKEKLMWGIAGALLSKQLKF